MENNRKDFTALFLNLRNLNSLINENPDDITISTILLLEKCLGDDAHISQSKSFFLFREIATLLIQIILNSEVSEFRDKSIDILKKGLFQSNGDRLRAISEAVGILPVLNKCFEINENQLINTPEISFNDLPLLLKVSSFQNIYWKGRSLICHIDEKRLLVIKFLKEDDLLENINKEPFFMKFLSENIGFDKKFEIPEPLKFSDSYIFSIKNLPLEKPQKYIFHPEKCAIAFLVSTDYFVYPNEKHKSLLIDDEIFSEVMRRNSYLFGQLAGKGILHTAPIPLFHNRVQAGRRDDHGLYLWNKGGRLDSWLSSCEFPNFGLSGLRDFEHFQIINKNNRDSRDNRNSKLIHFNVGSHILSMILVIGSYFRTMKESSSELGHKQKNLNGVNDSRSLFDKTFFKNSLSGIVENYYKGFTGNYPEKKFIEISDEFIERLVFEMGVDNHMEEILRVADQNEMDKKTFQNFLLDRGFSVKESAGFKKGEKDITIFNGPHLGGFNQKISLPELVEFLFVFSGVVMIDGFEKNYGCFFTQ